MMNAPFPESVLPKRLFDPAPNNPSSQHVHIYLDPCKELQRTRWLFRDASTFPLCRDKFCFSGSLHLTWSSASAPAAKTHRDLGGLAELRQFHCTWFKSRLLHLFLMLEQLPDEISVCVRVSPNAQSDCLAPRNLPNGPDWADLHVAWPDLVLFVCLFVLNETGRPEEKEVQHSKMQFNVACTLIKTVRRKPLPTRRGGFVW